jgi:GMP synthase (glutamine-hydrolysing)
MITIVDCGSQLTQNIARRVREMRTYSEIVSYKTPASEIAARKPDGIIISGGQFSVYDASAPLYDKAILELGKPVLGICYGQQSIAHLLGGEVTPTTKREYGKTKIVIRYNKLFDGINERDFNVWMSHGDVVTKLPEGFSEAAWSESGHIASIFKDNIYAVQFHPEVDHTEYGRKILENFVDGICCAQKDWNNKDFLERTGAEIREKAGNGIVIGGVSGGVDSSVGSVWLSQLLGDQYHAFFVNNGVLRKNEDTEVMQYLGPLIKNLHYVDASDEFLDKLKGVTDPDQKRKIIGNTFIEVFEREAKKVGGAKYLFQGTLYPDVIESVPIYGCSSKIKLHHNVGGLPERMNLQLIEPWRYLFKDEVRRIGEAIAVPHEVVWRHPFPGPGLAVRIIGDVTPEKLAILREADEIYISELRKSDQYEKIAQAFAVLLPIKTVGVMGDEGTYQSVVGLRAVTTDDFMTSDWYGFGKEFLTKVSNRIINEVKGVNRVVYDVSQKPPSTIEWE